VRDLIASSKNVFLDLKYHDITSTVAAAVREAASLSVSMLTVHASGGSKMLRAAAEAARGAKLPPKVLAVTVLTSMDSGDLNEIGVAGQLGDHVFHLTKLALETGCDGVVSSAHEVQNLRAKLGNDFLAVTPGVRPAGATHGDQARVVTPAEAIAAGATHLVVGRPITAAPNPIAAVATILQDIEHAELTLSR
jgi:orotidine-5'-phosphate decarboxylase